MKILRHKKVLFLLLFFSIIGLQVFAGTPPGGGCEPDVDPDCTDEVPLDSGLFMLVFAVILFSFYRFISTRKTVAQ